MPASQRPRALRTTERGFATWEQPWRESDAIREVVRRPNPPAGAGVS
jgi:hypothetical protein